MDWAGLDWTAPLQINHLTFYLLFQDQFSEAIHVPESFPLMQLVVSNQTFSDSQDQVLRLI